MYKQITLTPTSQEGFKPNLLPPDILFRKMVENMNEAVWMGDSRERTIYANPKFCSMMEFSLEEMLGRESYEFWDKESAKTVRKVNITKRKKGVSSSYEGNLLTKSGKKIPVFLSGTPLPDGGTIGIMTDISELKRKEGTEKMLNGAIQHASDAIIIFNSEGVVKSWNQGGKMVFGYKREEMLGAPISQLFPQEQIAPFLRKKRGVHNVELKTKHKNGKTITVAATLTTIQNQGENEVFYLLIARDITIQIQFQHEIALKYQKIQEAYLRFGVIRRQMDYVFEILELLDSSTEKPMIANYIVSSIIMLFKTDACILRVFNPQKDTLDMVSSFGVDDAQGKASIKRHDSLVQKAFEQKTSMKILDIYSEPRYQSAYLAKKNNLASLLLVPLIFQGQLIGSLSLYAKPNKKLAIFDNEFIDKYAKIIGIALYTVFFKSN